MRAEGCPEAESVVTGPDDGEAYTSPAEERDLSPAVETAEDDEPRLKLWSGRDSLSNIVVGRESGGVEEIASGHAATDDEVEQIMRPEEELEAHDPFSSGRCMTLFR